MLKRLMLILLTLCMVLTLAACAESEPAEKEETRPADWNTEAEVLRFCNGFYRAKTEEDLKPYVHSETADARIKELVDETNAALEGNIGTLDYRDYPFDAVEVTVLDTYKDYEILWVKLSSSAFEKAIKAQSSHDGGPASYTMIGPNMLVVVTVENGHYVTSLDEDFAKEVLEKYNYCNECHGSGESHVFLATCLECNGFGAYAQCVCNDCGEMFSGTILPEPNISPVVPEAGDAEGSVNPGILEINPDTDLLVVPAPGYACPACDSGNVSVTRVTCETCQGEGGQETEPQKCTVCNGNGWIKK